MPQEPRGHLVRAALRLGQISGGVNNSIGAATAEVNPVQQQLPSGSAGVSASVANVKVVVAADGNRSSASSEGFCENDDFGGDTSSSHNYCPPGQAVVPGQKSALTESDSQSSFDAVSQQSKDEVPVGGVGVTVGVEQVLSTSDTSSASSASSSASTASGSSNSSTSSMLMAGQEATVGAGDTVQQTPRRLSKDESFSSSSDEFNQGTVGGSAGGVGGAGGNGSAVGEPVQGGAGATAGGDLTPVPSTSAAARAALAASSSVPVLPTSPHLVTSAAGGMGALGLGASVDQPCTSSAHTSRTLAAAVAASSDKPHVFSNVRPTEDAWDILLARAEGLHAHGHGGEACILAVRLAEQMLANPPNLLLELPPAPKRKGKKQNVKLTKV